MIRPVPLIRIPAFAGVVLAVVVAGLAAAPASHAATCNKPLPAGDRTIELTSEGQARPFLLYVPEGYDGTSARPLVLNLHGTSADGRRQMDISGLRAYADKGDFLVAAPTGGARSGTGASWVVPGTPPRGEAPPGGFPNDVAYLSEVITKVRSIACLDQAKVIATGHSGGGRMTSAVACGLADRVAAVVVNAGLRAGAPRTGASGQPEPNPDTCAPSRPLSVIAVHGTADGVNPYDGGGSADWQYSVPAAFARWQQLLGCSDVVATTAFAPEVDQLDAGNCQKGAVLRLFRVNGGGHRWFGSPVDDPASGPDPMQIRTSDLVADAVRTHGLRRPRPALKLTCRPGARLRIRATAHVDAPLAALTVRANGRLVVRSFKTSTTRTIRLGKSRSARVSAVASDRAGLTSKVLRVKRCA